jgi:hypothetical protein
MQVLRVLNITVILWAMSLQYAIAEEPHPDRGLYAIWAKPEAMELPYITGGQIVLQWRDLNPQEGVFDFSELDARMRALHSINRKSTIQINGNRKPDWLYNEVPWHPEKLTVQIRQEEKGSLMYWHPNHLRAYTEFLQAWATHLKQSPYRSMVLGIRQNFNALGTEHHAIPQDKQSLDQWIVPPGVTQGRQWTREIGHEYDMEVVSAFVEYFSDDFRVFVRNNLPESLRTPFRSKWENGTLAWFHTSTEAEPRSVGTERQYLTFLDYCRTGKTLGYAECWAGGWGWHGVKQDPRWCSPPQWNYWRLLCDLHCGVSFIGIYGTDLQVAIDGAHRGRTFPEYVGEFDQAFKFAARYAGYAAYPAQSPGAWIAFRHSTVNLNYNRPIESITGNYTFHMRQLEKAGVVQRNIGPDENRFGAWALHLQDGERLRLEVDKAFCESLENQTATATITYLDRGAGTLHISIGDTQHSQQLDNSGEWKTTSFRVHRLAAQAPAVAALLCEGSTVYLHMVSLERNQ